jgi:hypothetical protein
MNKTCARCGKQFEAFGAHKQNKFCGSCASAPIAQRKLRRMCATPNSERIAKADEDFA